MRSIVIAASLAAAVAVAGCGLTPSARAPLEPAPTPGAAEVPARVLDIDGSQGDSQMSLRVFDRSFALTGARSATRVELAGSEDLDENTVAAYQTTGGQILVKWAGSACREGGDLFVGSDVDEVVIARTSTETCEPSNNVRGVVLEFKLGVDLKAIRFEVRSV